MSLHRNGQCCQGPPERTGANNAWLCSSDAKVYKCFPKQVIAKERGCPVYARSPIVEKRNYLYVHYGFSKKSKSSYESSIVIAAHVFSKWQSHLTSPLLPKISKIILRVLCSYPFYFVLKCQTKIIVRVPSSY